MNIPKITLNEEIFKEILAESKLLKTPNYEISFSIGGLFNLKKAKVFMGISKNGINIFCEQDSFGLQGAFEKKLCLDFAIDLQNIFEVGYGLNNFEQDFSSFVEIFIADNNTKARFHKKVGYLTS